MSKFKFKTGLIKKVAILSAIALFTATFTGCNKEVSDTSEDGRTVISIGNYPDKDGDEKDAWDARWQKFEQDNPDVKVEPDKWVYDVKTFYSKEAGGKLPNLFVSHFTEIGQYMDIECVADLTDVLKARGYEGMIEPKILNVVSDDEGRIFAVPTSTYVFGMMVNTDMFEAAGLMEADGTPKQPKDWEEVRDFAVKIKEATGKPGIIFPTAANVGGWIFTNIAWSYGTEFMKQDENGKWLATFNTPETAEALQYVKDLKWKYDVLPANTLIDYAEYFKTFATNNAAMIVCSGSAGSQFVKYDMDPNTIGVIAMPKGPKRHVTLLGGELYALSKDSTPKQQDAAIRWLETMFNYKATDDFKANKKAELEQAKKDNKIIGVKPIKPWSGDAESVKFEYELIDEYINVNPNHVKLYNDFVENCPADIQQEEPICAQQLYSVLDGCIQEVLNNKDADCTELLEKANSDFQINYLDTMAN